MFICFKLAADNQDRHVMTHSCPTRRSSDLLKTRADSYGNGYVVNGQKVWTSRALHSDLMLLIARTTPLDQVKKRTEGLSTFLVDMREAKGKGLEIRPIDAIINHNTTEAFFDNPRLYRTTAA